MFIASLLFFQILLQSSSIKKFFSCCLFKIALIINYAFIAAFSLVVSVCFAFLRGVFKSWWKKWEKIFLTKFRMPKKQ